MPAVFADLNRYGTHQRQFRGDWRRNKFGVLSGINEIHETEKQDDLNYGLMTVAAAPVEKVPCVTVDRQWDEQKLYARYIYTYDGLVEGDNTFQQRVFCRVDGNDSEEPIETHPNFAALFKKHQGRRDKIGRFSHFAQNLSVGVRTEGVEANPLYGVDHFLSFTMVFVRTYVVRAVPQSVWSRVDCIDTPNGTGRVPVPTLKGKRNWLKLAPLVDERENYATIAERWMASGRNGWNPDIYSEKSAMGQSA